MNRKHSLVVALVVSVLCLSGLSTAEENAIDKTWSKKKAWQWYNSRPWINGCNYLPSYAGNSTEFWQADTFDPEMIDKELALAAGVGYNSVRVLMQYLVWEEDPEDCKKRFSTFLEIADKHGISVMPQFFDDCAFGLQPDKWKRKDPYLGKQDDPIAGAFFPNWAPSPGHSRVTDESAWPQLKKYVLDFMATFKEDERVLAWDLYNEPTNGGVGNKSVPLLKAVFRWAREIEVSQPVTAAVWNGNDAINSVMLENSDVITFHQYPAPDPNRFKETGRPVICTEWMIRIRGSHVHKDIFAKTLPVLKEKRIGSYSWGLVNGRSQAQFQWGSKPGTPEPEVWFTDIFRDVHGTPYDPKEIEVLRKVSGIAENGVSETNVSIRHVVIEGATAETPRSDTASVAEFSDGRLMVVYHKYERGKHSGRDHGTCRIWSKVSHDGGRSWQQPRMIVDVEQGDMNVQAPALLRRKSGRLLLICLRAHQSGGSSTMCLFSSDDQGKTFSPLDPVWKRSKGQLLQGGASSLVELRSGRLLLPFHGGSGNQWKQTNSAWCFASDDNGKTWNRSTAVDLPKRGAMEASVAELADGTLLMSLRTQLGGPYLSRSTDAGKTWSEAVFSGLEGGESCTCLRRIPATDNLILFWNNSKYYKRHHHFGERTPLTAAISSDNGRSWRTLGNIADDPKAEYTNLDCLFTSKGDAILTYMVAKPAWNRNQIHLKAALIPRRWFDKGE